MTKTERLKWQWNHGRWTGPRDEDWADREKLKEPPPPERWPYGAPEAHDEACLLFDGGLFCDCAASAYDE